MSEKNTTQPKVNSNTLGNYITVIIICFSNVLLVYPNSLKDFDFFLGNFIGALVLPAILLEFITFLKERGLAKHMLGFL
jgi:hypothetical protein